MSFYRRRPDGIVLMQARPEHAPQLEALQIECFPTLDDAERLKTRHYLHHMKLFPAGQIVALEGDRVIGATSSIRLNFDFSHPSHTFADILEGGWLTSHEPDGTWLYGADMAVSSYARGRGIATALYAARQELVYRLGLEGQVTVGMMNGYGRVKESLPAESYYADVVAGTIRDTTLSMQMGVGFEPRALLANYLNDPVCDNYGVLLVLPSDKDVKGARRENVTRYIRLETELPGPRSRALVARRAAALPSGLGKSTDIAVERAEGGLVYDVDGNTLIDLAGGIGMLAVGHSPAPVVEAICAQAQRTINPGSLTTTTEPMVELAELLNEITPGAFRKKTIFANSGAECVENAVKLARKYTGRSTIVCFEGGYHGRTLLTLSLTSKYGLFKSGFGPFAPEIVRLPMPNLYRKPAGISEEAYLDYSIEQLKLAMVAQVDPSAIAAFIIEPVQGEAGFVPVPARFLAAIRDLCTQHGIVMIADEVQSGFGRTGKLFAIEHYDIVPDMMVMAKSMGAGFPIGAVTGRAEIMDSAHLGGIGSTYGGGAIACAAALATAKMILEPGFLDHAQHLGEVMREVLSGWRKRWPIIGDVRGLGSMMLVELVADADTRQPLSPAETLAIVQSAIAQGVILIRAGLFSNCIRFLPPLNIPEDMLLEGLGAVERAIAAYVESHQAVTQAV
jgi:4-aminobutyrate aminotransferase/(S)-3-amino-2-methylpropionate transaminase